MNLNDCDMKRLLPMFMRKDEANRSLSDSVSSITRELSNRIRLLSVWNQINDMSSAELDELAWELNITWYNPNASVDIKRQIVKDSDLVYSKMGTKWAVERVANTYFGESRVKEWFEYGGMPFCFRIETANQKIQSTLANEFMRMLNIIKRASSHLDTIEVSASGDFSACFYSVSCEYESSFSLVNM